MKQLITIAYILLIVTSCRREFVAPVPNTDWDLFNSPTAVRLTRLTMNKMEGIYSFGAGADVFGDSTALKWSYTVSGNDTSYKLSMFCEKQAAYFILEGKRLDTSILLNGYWRKLVNTETGRVRLTINQVNGSNYLISPSPLNSNNKFAVTGTFSYGDAVPDRPVNIQYNRSLNRTTPFQIIAHRGGGRTADILPASENSIEILKLAPQLGSTGVEIDVRLTKDGIPILYHDARLNERLVQKSGLLGPIENYSYAQLNTIVRLKNGERIPTLRDALITIVVNTPLNLVWLDIKYHGSLQTVAALQAEFQQKANNMGRTLEIMIGIPDEEVQKNFLALPNSASIPSINELSPEKVIQTNSKVWAPRWTLGLQNEEVAAQQAQGRRAYVWTLDIPENIQQFILEGRFDGILSNYPSVVAYYHYAKK
ncbi:MAG TPA: glycerophosphodiester phosphodiesterase [Flavisolibacter sp.]|nr:glycerophosphodiester phosphodiesterase [Flavisolibacter sp.]